LLLARLAATGQGVFLLGGRPGVADDVAAWVRAHFPGARIAGTAHGYFPADAESALVDRINASGAGVLLVAFGAPRQETWIRRNAPRLRVNSALGVGGLFDFYAGRIPRAPQWLRELGLEWAYRLYQEPRRMWRRYLVGNVVFLSRVIAERARRQLRIGQFQEQVNS
jgi:N-acetylglucosaminyldiphosphoundecaprenol N-acetyl-beta-D-mannosaminyltransferase